MIEAALKFELIESNNIKGIVTFNGFSEYILDDYYFCVVNNVCHEKISDRKDIRAIISIKKYHNMVNPKYKLSLV